LTFYQFGGVDPKLPIKTVQDLILGFPEQSASNTLSLAITSIYDHTDNLSKTSTGYVYSNGTGWNIYSANQQSIYSELVNEFDG
jgi:hypothetical protein